MIELKKVDEDNIWEIVSLSVKDDQKTFVATNTKSILEAYTTITSGGVALPFGIYRGDTPVGFVMFGYGTDGEDGMPAIADDNYLIWRFMIAEAFQGQGLGRQALKESLKFLQTLPAGPAKYVWLSYEPSNESARALYSSMGFEENGQMVDDEVISIRRLDLPVS